MRSTSARIWSALPSTVKGGEFVVAPQFTLMADDLTIRDNDISYNVALGNGGAFSEVYASWHQDGGVHAKIAVHDPTTTDTTVLKPIQISWMAEVVIEDNIIEREMTSKAAITLTDSYDHTHHESMKVTAIVRGNISNSPIDVEGLRASKKTVNLVVQDNL